MTEGDAASACLAAGAIAWPRVCTVVVNWQRPEETLACVRSLLALDYPAQRIVVVDNSAGASGVEALLAGLPVQLVRNPANLGFTGGVNAGLRHARDAGADYVWLMNSDATAAPDALRKLVAAAEADPRIGLVSPMIHDPEARERPLFCLALLSPRSLDAHATADPDEARRWLGEQAENVVLYGTALLIRRALIEAIGGLDERFFAYVEDIDYSLRCREAGFRPVPCFDARVYHRFKEPTQTPQATPPYLYYFMTRNYLLLWRKRSRRLLLGRPALWLLRRCLLQIMRMPQNQPAIEAILAGLWDGARGIGGPYDPARRPPWWLRRTLGRHPRLFRDLLDRRLPFRRQPHGIA